MQPSAANFVFDPGAGLTWAFVLLTLFVVAADVALVRMAAPPGQARRWTIRGVAVVALWLAGHAALAESGVLERLGPPPAVAFYLPPTLLIGVALAASPLGARLATLPLWALVGLQAFRVPLEVWLHALYEAGALPVQMTWSGWNFDVLTGLGALLIALAVRRWELPAWVLWVWNLGGLGLLATVVVIAVTSTPGPLRLFVEDPPVVLAFHAPFNWIVGVHVFTALVGHLVIARALRARGRRVGA